METQPLGVAEEIDALPARTDGPPAEASVREPYQPTSDIHVLPTSVAVPGVGVLTTNAYVLHAQEPVLVDTGLAIESDYFVDALRSVIDPRELRWVWLTHDDADHTGSLERVLELAPQAKLVTHGLAALRMGTWWPVPLERVHAIRPGDALDVGDRTLRALRPPTFDNPTSAGIFDTATGALFSVDAFGAILPEATNDLSAIPGEALTAGMVAFATFDAPWTAIVDRAKFGQVIDEVGRLKPSCVLSSHLPAAGHDLVERFLKVLETVPDADPFPAPDHEAFGHLAAAMADARPAEVPAANELTLA
ncbi:MAG: MBL fold metallo-hydrolase [Acidimicrobiales bacterium]